MYAKPDVRLSCQQCQQRKRRCDKGNPCQTCRQAGIECTPISRPLRPRGRHAATREGGDLRTRVARLEKLLQAHGNPADAPSSHGQDPKRELDSAKTELAGIRDLMDELGIDDELSVDSQTNSIQNFDLLLFGNRSVFVQPDLLEIPPRPLMEALFDIYVHRIDKLFKVIHVPSLKRLLGHMNDSSPSHRALIFAMMFTAVNSLEEAECLCKFNLDKTDFSNSFRLATEVILSQCDLLTTTDLMVLQAYVIYMTGLPTSGTGYRRLHALVATAVRIGQSLGLDLDQARHTPFETEMRRRTWYSIGILDLRAESGSGLHSSLYDGALFKRAPLHINDVDISPTDSVAPEEAQSFSDMSFCCATYELLRHMRDISHVPKDADGRPLFTQDWTKRLSIPDNCARKLHQICLQYCKANDPFHFFTTQVCRGMISILQLMARRPMHRLYGAGIPPDDDFDVLEMATNILDQNSQKTSNADFQAWRWFTWPKWYALSVQLAELCQQPKGIVAERAWKVAEMSFAKMEEAQLDPVLWTAIRKLMHKARAYRGINSKNILPKPELKFASLNSTPSAFPEELPDIQSILQVDQYEPFLVQDTRPLGDTDMFSNINWDYFMQDLTTPDLL